MVRECLAHIKHEAAEAYSLEFIRNFQAALLLSLLDKGLLTQGQFEACAEEIQKRGGSSV